MTASRNALARTALTTVPVTRALALAQWTGDSRELTTTGALRPVVAVQACLSGKGACPPEDCGGPWGNADLKETIADPSAEGHEERLEWLGLEDPSDFDTADFDLAVVNARLHGPE